MSHDVAAAAEKRWAFVVGAIIFVIIAMMVFTGLHWASMPPSRVETIDPRTLHISGEFVEGNLGTSVGADGKVVEGLIAQQYSFEPQCLLVPAGMPVTFRATSTDVIHGFVVGNTNANVMLIPGYVATFTTTFPKAGEQLMPARNATMGAREGTTRTVKLRIHKSAERMSCVRRQSSYSRISGSPSPPSAPPHYGRWQCRRSPLVGG